MATLGGVGNWATALTGLLLPRTCCAQVVLIPIPNSKTAPEVKEAMLAKVAELSKQLAAAGVKVATDAHQAR